MGDFVAYCLLALLGLFLLSAGIEDVRTREIANWKTASIALIAPLWWWSLGLSPWPDMAWQIGFAAVVFALFVGAFAIGQMGGGDVKLIGALALWLPWQPFVNMFVWMTVIGGALTAIMVVDEWIRRRAAPPRPSRTIVALVSILVVSALIAVRNIGLSAILSNPLALLGAVLALTMLVAALMLSAIRAARRRGIAPETPYGVAIAIAGLIALREPIINQFG